MVQLIIFAHVKKLIDAIVEQVETIAVTDIIDRVFLHLK